ncbi:unnamed protein product [Brugia timori]|uniref:Srp40 C-terminal domain-containing protein n=1 Tax=Brugia timori TaxID=42155 RepID=A0A3P7UJ99_9BILA|nr:unnamed protein product [Brugia timori]
MGKAIDTLKADSYEEDKNKKSRSQKNADLKKEDNNTDLKDENDDPEKMGNNQKSMGKNNKKQKVLQNEPFRRVKTSKDELHDKFRDNSYRTKTYDQWGRKAYEDMKNVQGKGFRHEKTKKKRGCYSGGSGAKIDTSSHSIKFSSDTD